MNIDFSKIQKFRLIKSIKFFLVLVGIVSIVFLNRNVQEFIIVLAEKLVDRSLTHEKWIPRLSAWNSSLFLIDFVSLVLLFVVPNIEKILEWNKNKIENLDYDHKIRIVYCVVFSMLLLIIHSFLPVPTKDDLFFAAILEKQSTLEFLKDRWDGAASRLLIEGVLINLFAYSAAVWRVIDTFVLVLICESIISICFKKENYKYSFVVYLMMLFLTPYNAYNSAGWACTTLNYEWPFAAIMPSFVIIKKIISGEQVKRSFMIIALFAAVFGCNAEQVAALTFGYSFVFFAYDFYSNGKKLRKEHLFFAFLFIISLISVFYIAVCPGNANRDVAFAKNWFNDYESIGILQKVQWGFFISLSYLYGINELNFILVPLLVILTIKSKANKRLFVIQLCIDFIIIVFGYLLHGANSIFRFYNYYALFRNTTLLPHTNFHEMIFQIQTFLYSFAFILTLVSIYMNSKTTKARLANIVIFGSGFCSAFILAFSASVYQSGVRTYIFFIVAIYIVTIRLFFDKEL